MKPRLIVQWKGAKKKLVEKPRKQYSMKRSKLRKMSPKERAKLTGRAECKEIVRKRSGGYCEARLYGCTVLACHVHEIIPRSQGGSITDPNNCLHVCWTCHRMIHGFPNTARKLGLLKDNK